MVLGFLFLWVICGVIVGAIAQSKGRSFGGWFVYGFLLFIVAIVHVLVAQDLSAPRAVRIVGTPEPAAWRDPCPHCAEMILPEAKVCRFCGRDVVRTLEPTAAA